MSETALKENISVTPPIRKTLIEKYGSRTTVHFALIYFTNSDKAKQIRRKAKQLLLEEANKIKS